jgi:MarR family transcriptional regulator, temperature-dependent positive regulator of motility
VPETRTKGTITLLAQITKVIHRRTTEELLGIKWKHFVALSVLHEKPVVSQQTLCDQMVMDPNNCVLLLNELESAGYVERRRDPTDRRRHIVELTDAGRDAFELSVRAREAIEDDVLRGLDREERDTLRRLLVKALTD